MPKWRDKDGVEHDEEHRPAGAVRRIKADREALDWPKRILAELHWYAVLARSGTEFAVEAILERRGFVAVVPMHTEWRRANRYAQRKHEVSYPVAPRYVLVGFTGAQLRHGAPPWHQVFSITMVQSVVGLGETPWRMRGAETADFVKAHSNRRAPDEYANMGMRAGYEFKAGDTVKVMEGSLAGLTVKVSAIEGKAAKVLLPLFGKQEQEFPLNVAHLEPVEDCAGGD
jgi:transcription antitermination factor NusG